MKERTTTILLIVFALLLVIASYIAGRVDAQKSTDNRQHEEDSLKNYSAMKELRFEEKLAAKTSENQLLKEQADRSLQFVSLTLNATKRTNEKFRIISDSVIRRYVDSVRTTYDGFN